MLLENNKGEIFVNSCILKKNTIVSERGAGIYSKNLMSLKVKNSTISENEGSVEGGGIYIEKSDSM